MIESIDTSLVDWSRAQFALTAMYHWIFVLIKLFIMFFILKLFFFPNFLNSRPEGESKEEFVGKELINRANP